MTDTNFDSGEKSGHRKSYHKCFLVEAWNRPDVTTWAFRVHEAQAVILAQRWITQYNTVRITYPGGKKITTLIGD